MKRKHTTIILFLFIVTTFTLSAQVVENEAPVSKKELRAKRKKVREVQKINKINEVRSRAKELLVAKDFVVKDDGRSGVSGVVSFFKIQGDVITIQTF